MKKEFVRPTLWSELKQLVIDAWFPVLVWAVIVLFVGEVFFSWLHGHPPMIDPEPPYERGP